MRIRVARAARRHPVLLDMLRDGRLHLSAIVRLRRCSRSTTETVLGRATHASSARSSRSSPSSVPGPTSLPHPQTAHAHAPPRSTGESKRPGRPRTALRPVNCAGHSCCVLSQTCTTPPPRPARVPAASSPMPPTARSEFRARRRGRRTALARPLQGPVHGERRAARQARAAIGRDALPAARKRPGRGDRCGRQRKARAARGPPLRHDERPSKGPRRHGHAPGVAPCAGGRAPCGARARWNGCAFRERRADAAPSAIGSSSTTGVPSAWAGTTTRATSPCSAAHTTSSWRGSTTGRQRSGDASPSGT